MMLLKVMFVCIMGISFGVFVSSGVFTVLFVVGLVPRFAGKTNTAKYELFYEECIISGSIISGLLSVFPIKGSLSFTGTAGNIVLIIIGIFAGIFVGCLAIALSEVLDGIPIFARRVKLKKGIDTAVFSLAVGKAAGSLIYFILNFFRK